jgi:hypothetical protein
VVPDIYNALTAPYIQTSIFIWTYLPCYCRYLDNSLHVIQHTLGQMQRTSSGLSYVNCGPGHIECIYSSAHSGFNIQLNVSALILVIYWQTNERYTANWETNIAHILQFILCWLWSPPYTMKWQQRIFSLQYSTERSSATIADMSTIQW